MLANAFPYMGLTLHEKSCHAKQNVHDVRMAKAKGFPRELENNETINVRLPAELKALTIEVAAEAGFKNLGSFVRALFWQQCRDARPADFARIKGVG